MSTGGGELVRPVAIESRVAKEAAATLKALGEPLRLRVLSAISNSTTGRASVTDLLPIIDVTAPTLSHHLRVLREAGVLTQEREGTWLFYRIAPAFAPTAAAILDHLVGGGSWLRDAAHGHGLVDVDDALDRVAKRLHGAHPNVDPELVLVTVRESYAALARKAVVPDHLVSLAERFARQRVADLAKALGEVSHKPQVLFVCVANAGRSQLAAALLTRYAGDRIVVRSAGSEPGPDVHLAVKPYLEELGAVEAFPKPLTDDAVRAADVVVTMGCGDVCPVVPGVSYEDWAIPDPALASPEDLQFIVSEIEARVKGLVDRLLSPQAKE